MQPPTFGNDALVLAKGWPAIYGGDSGTSYPTLAKGPNGSLFVQYNGCSDGLPFEPVILAHAGADASPPACIHRTILRSEDSGKTWHGLNDDSGRLAPGAPSSVDGGGVAVDAAGTVYALEAACNDYYVNPTAGEGCAEAHELIVQSSADNGESWTYAGDLLAESDYAATMASMAAGGSGHVIFAWKAGYVYSNSQLALRATFDGGQSFTPTTYLQQRLDNIGRPAIAPNGKHAYVPYPVQVREDPPLSQLRVAVTSDGGRSWDEVSTGIDLPGIPGSAQCQQGNPSIAVTDTGMVALAYTKLNADQTTFSLMLTTSVDHGGTWSNPVVISEARNAANPRLVALKSNALLVFSGAGRQGEAGSEWVFDLEMTLVPSADVSTSSTLASDLVRYSRIPPLAPLLAPSNGAPVANDIGTLLGVSALALADGRVAVVYTNHPLASGGIEQLDLKISSTGHE